KAALEQVDAVSWIPEWGHTRIHNMIAERNDWCISRQRIWGVPLPIFYCEACGEALITADSIAAVAKAFRQGGSDVWWSKPAADLLPAGTRCACSHTAFRKETDIMDVWFDSGSSHVAVLQGREELAWPADLYLEGSDQHRGWFQSSLLTAVATEGAAPYRAVLTHGFIVDGNGNKMSKSVGNTISPADVMKRFGADILRLWAASADYRGDIRLSDEILEQTADAYRKIRNTCRFLLGNLADFNPEAQVPYARLAEIDRWLLDRLARLDERVRRAYERYEYHVLYHAVHNFCAVDLSGFYLDVVRDTLYCDPKESAARRSAQSAMYLTLEVLTKLLAPVLAFTADEIWEHVPGAEGSVHLQRFAELPAAWRDDDLAERWSGLQEVRSLASRAIERARQAKAIRSSAGAEVWLELDDAARRTLAGFTPEALRALFLVAAVHLDEALPAEGWRETEGANVAVARPTDQARCERCWRHEPEVGALPEHPELCRRCAAALG
ncbi:MAG TPA: class I tRNA ligase family protein, partial [Limnochordia bacterium]|nr:class I tRNA ligase family protein [Limnochordia bacterium]